MLPPPIVQTADSDTDYLYSDLQARTLAENPLEASDFLVRHLATEILSRKAAPSFARGGFGCALALHFVLNIYHALETVIPRLKHFSGGRCDIRDLEAIHQRVLDFVLPGLLGVRSA